MRSDQISAKANVPGLGICMLLIFIIFGNALKSRAENGRTGFFLGTMASSDIDVRIDGFNEAYSDHDRLVDSIIEFAKVNRVEASEEFYSSWKLAVDLLGRSRSHKAVGYLVSEVSTRVPTIIVGDTSLVAAYPADKKEILKSILGVELALKKLELELHNIER